MSKNYKGINIGHKNIIPKIEKITYYDKMINLNSPNESYLTKLFDSFKNSKNNGQKLETCSENIGKN